MAKAITVDPKVGEWSSRDQTRMLGVVLIVTIKGLLRVCH